MRGGKFVKAPLRKLSLLQVRHVSTVAFGDAGGDTLRVYRALERDFGVLAPPIALHAPVPELLCAAWVTLRETMLVDGAAPRAAKEAVATAVSVSNTCPFCTTMHSAMLDSLTARPGAAGAERPDGVAAWATAGGRPPFPADQLPELAGTALCLQYLNRMVNVFLGSMPLPPGAPDKALGPVVRVLVGLMRGAGRAGSRPGASLSLLPAAPLPPSLAWAAGDPRIADAVARSTAAVEEVARELVPEPVLALVGDLVAGWDGADPGLGRSWVDGPLAQLPPADRTAGELALLTAMASYRVDDKVIGAFRADGADDRHVLAVTAWASQRAAIGRTRRMAPDN